jgi:hypothetical protein
VLSNGLLTAWPEAKLEAIRWSSWFDLLWPPPTELPFEILVFERLPFRGLRLVARKHSYERPLEIATQTGPDLVPELV